MNLVNEQEKMLKKYSEDFENEENENKILYVLCQYLFYLNQKQTNEAREVLENFLESDLTEI